MQKQSSRNPSNIDAIDCMVNTNDLALENEAMSQDNDPQRRSSSTRRDTTSKRSNENSTYRSSRHSPPSVTRKRHANSPPMSSSSSSKSRSYTHHSSSHRHSRVSSPSPSPPQSSSRDYRRNRPSTTTKRVHSPSRSPYERRPPPSNRSRPQSSQEQINTDVILSTNEQVSSKKRTPNKETGDLSLISEDESTKIHDVRPNGVALTNESSTLSKNNQLHSTPSLPVLEPNSNESVLEMSNFPSECELSLFAKSNLSTINKSSISSTATPAMNDFVQTIDLINKYKTIQTKPSDDPVVETFSRDILSLIKRQIELQKKELECREREIKLRERELEEREKRFNEKSNDSTSTTSVKNEPSVEVKPTILEEPIQPKLEMIVDQNVKNASQEESVEKSIPPDVDRLKRNPTNKTGSDQPTTSTRKTGGKSRFSQLIVNPSIFAPQENPGISLYEEDRDDNQLPSSSLNTNESIIKTTISNILEPTESAVTKIDPDLKVTSSSSCRKVEFHDGKTDKIVTNKGTPDDLRFTLSKKRSESQNINTDNGTNGHQLTNDDEQTISSKINSNKEDKQQSYDYQQQRSVTSSSIETFIDNNNEKRYNRRHQRNNNSRQHQYSSQNSSSSTNNSNERSYSQGSTSQQQSKYGSNQKRYESDDLRSRIVEHKYPKSSRPTHRNN